MKKVFRNDNQLQCIFTDEGVTFCGIEQEVFYPYGCLDYIKMSFLGVLQAASHTKICSFAVDHKDRAEVKALVKQANQAMKTAPKTVVQMIDLSKIPEADQVPSDLPPEEQLKRYKMLFVQGVISKEEYDIKKRLLKE